MNERVKVLSLYDPAFGGMLPQMIHWGGQDHRVSEITAYRRARVGNLFFHTYLVKNGSYYFKLFLDSETLSWRLQEIDDYAATNA
ncbi:MAG TPA: hypothetical protein VJL83_04075 [Patescibacteria group bacterium]|nr:hypothetical protein [Patescibacteria group bacterium]